MDIKVTIIQSDLHWENVDENLNMFSEKINAISEKTDVIVLPEMFNTGFSMQSDKLAETMDGKTVNWMLNQSEKSNSNSTYVGNRITFTFASYVTNGFSIFSRFYTSNTFNYDL